jgi:hypothetical protein
LVEIAPQKRKRLTRRYRVSLFLLLPGVWIKLFTWPGLECPIVVTATGSYLLSFQIRAQHAGGLSTPFERSGCGLQTTSSPVIPALVLLQTRVFQN